MSKPIFEDMFTFHKERRNRKSLILFMLLQILIFVPVLAFLSLITPYLGHYLQISAGIFVLVCAGLILISQCAILTQRCRDLNWTGWLVLLLFIPVVSFIFLILLFCKRGTDGKNNYGQDPLKKPNQFKEFTS